MVNNQACCNKYSGTLLAGKNQTDSSVALGRSTFERHQERQGGTPHGRYQKESCYMPFGFCRLLVFMCFGLPAAVIAAPLTLEEAFSKTLATHPAIGQRKNNLAASEDEVDSAKWKRYPTLSGEVSSRVGSAQTGDPYPGKEQGAAWRVQQPLWAGGPIDAEIDGATQRQKIAAISVNETEQDLLIRVTQGFFELSRLTEREVIARDNMTQHKKLLAMISRRADQEVTSQADVALARARLQQVSAEWVSARSALQTTTEQLAQLVNDPLSEGVQLPRIPRLPWANLDDLVAEASGSAPALRRLEESITLAETDAEAKKSVLYPQLSLRYEKYAGLVTTNPYDRVMLVMEYQPGAGFGAVSASSAANKRVDASRQELISGRRDLRDRLAKEYNDAWSYNEQLDPAEQYLEAARSVMDSYVRQYAAGRKSWLEVLNAQREWAQARNGKADVVSAAGAAIIRLGILAGRITGTGNRLTQ